MEKKKFPKPKKCKNCGSDFVPYDTLVPCCSAKCHAKWKQAKEKEKKAKAREAKKISVKALTAKADKLFSEYVRRRDSDRYGVCVTCGIELPYDKSQCGHFISRARKATRWDERNASAQCPGCNLWGSGRQYEHGLELDSRLGEGTAKEMLSKSNSDFKLTSEFLLEVIEDLTRRKTTAN